MPLFNTITEDAFIAQFWQKKPLVTRQAFSDLDELVSGDELAGLACEAEVESRIISGRDHRGEWTCRQGPFNNSDFEHLLEENWTLLVQGLDQWDDDIRGILAQFDFLPKWRLEDIMASYAPIGGGVGPHFDYYDVFLIQVSGSREWKLGQHCDEHTALLDNTQVKLLADFKTQSTDVLNPGDMLYIPAGIAHWGTALSDDCVTFSVGFRAPSEKEMIAEALEVIVKQLSDHRRYKDTKESLDTHPHKLNTAVHTNLLELSQQLTPELLQNSLKQAFGQLVTEPRYSAMEDEDAAWTLAELESLLQTQKVIKLVHYPHSRFAFSDGTLFVNGDVYTATEDFSQMICEQQITRSLSDKEQGLLLDLLNQSVIALDNDE